MACNHKFQNELNLEGLDYEPTTLIVGTFNPEWPQGNNAQWFYGRTHDEHGNQNNNFWDVLPRLYGEESLIDATHIEWKQFCHKKKIAITDIIQSINDANQQIPDHVSKMRSYSDDDIAEYFYDFDLTNLVRIIRNHPSIINVYVTRSYSATFWKHKIYPLKWFCEFTGRNLKPVLTPSSFAFREQSRYNKLNPNNQFDLSDFIRYRWELVWHEI